MATFNNQWNLSYSGSNISDRTIIGNGKVGLYSSLSSNCISQVFYSSSVNPRNQNNMIETAKVKFFLNLLIIVF